MQQNICSFEHQYSVFQRNYDNFCNDQDKAEIIAADLIKANPEFNPLGVENYNDFMAEIGLDSKRQETFDNKVLECLAKGVSINQLFIDCLTDHMMPKAKEYAYKLMDTQGH